MRAPWIFRKALWRRCICGHFFSEPYSVQSTMGCASHGSSSVCAIRGARRLGCNAPAPKAFVRTQGVGGKGCLAWRCFWRIFCFALPAALRSSSCFTNATTANSAFPFYRRRWRAFSSIAQRSAEWSCLFLRLPFACWRTRSKKRSARRCCPYGLPCAFAWRGCRLFLRACPQNVTNARVGAIPMR